MHPGKRIVEESSEKEKAMFTILADTMRIASREDRWGGYDHWRKPDMRNWEIERRLAEERAKDYVRPGLL